MARAEPAVLPAGAAAIPAATAARAQPVTLAREQVLPVVEGLAPLVPGGALQRGSTVVVAGRSAMSLALALAAGPSQVGGWTVAIGLSTLGLQAAAELGVALSRLVLVAVPEARQWATVVATALDGFDVVLLRVPHRVRLGELRRLQARARQRGSVLVALTSQARQASGLEADLALRAGTSHWEGIGAGHGHLRARQVHVEVGGRRTRAAQHSVWLPDAEGRVHVVEPVAPVVSLRSVG